MPSTAADRFALGNSAAFTEKVQILGQKQARTISEQVTAGNGGNALITNVTFNQALAIAEKFIRDQGFYAGKMSLDIVNDAAIEAFWNGTAFAGITDAAISGVLPYTFALYRNVP